MSPSLQSRSSYNWEPSYPALPAPVLRGFPQSITRNSREWRTSLGSQQSQQISAIAATGASTTVSLLVGFSVITGPIGAAIAGAIAIAQLLVGIFQGCGQTCVEASNIANQVEPALQQNLAAYLASPVRTVSMQAAFLNNFQHCMECADSGVWQSIIANGRQELHLRSPARFLRLQDDSRRMDTRDRWDVHLYLSRREWIRHGLLELVDRLSRSHRQ